MKWKLEFIQEADECSTLGQAIIELQSTDSTEHDKATVAICVLKLSCADRHYPEINTLVKVRNNEEGLCE